MRLIPALCALAVLAAGCGGPAAFANPQALTTEEIIYVLENENIEWLTTTHSQHIEFKLKSGRSLAGKYRPDEAPEKYRNNPHLSDILT